MPQVGSKRAGEVPEIVCASHSVNSRLASCLLCGTDPVLHKDAREEMRRVREEQQRRWSEQAAKAAEELQARQRAKKLEKHREAKKASRSMGGSGGE